MYSIDREQISVGPKAKAFPNMWESVSGPLMGLARAWKGSRSEKGIGQVVALDNVSTILEPDKLYLVLGGPKSGKTTLLKGIAGR